MKIGTISLWRDSVAAFVDEVQLAERVGAHMVTVGDSQSLYRELYVSLAIVAEVTETAFIGPMVTNPTTRHPAVVASGLAALDELSGGRVVFGIGTGGSAVWALGERPASLASLSAYLETLRSLWTCGTAEWRGQQIHVDGIERRVKLFVAAEGPRTLRLAGALADGILLHSGASTSAIRWCRAHVEEGARSVGRDPDDISLWVMLKASIFDDRERALREARAGLAGSARHALSSHLDEKGIPADLVEPLRQLIERYDVRTHAKAVSDNAQLVDNLGLTAFLAEMFGLVGSPAECAARLRTLRALGIEGVLVPAIGSNPMGLIERLGLEVLPLVGD